MWELRAPGPHERGVPLPQQIVAAATLPGAENESKQPDFRPGSREGVLTRGPNKWAKYLRSQRTYEQPVVRQRRCNKCNAEFESGNKLHRHIERSHGRLQRIKDQQQAAELEIDALVSEYSTMTMQDTEDTTSDVETSGAGAHNSGVTIESESEEEDHPAYELHASLYDPPNEIGCEPNPAENSIPGLSDKAEILYEGEAWDSDRLLLRYMNVTPSEEEAPAAAAAAEEGGAPNAPSFFHSATGRRSRRATDRPRKDTVWRPSRLGGKQTRSQRRPS